MPYNYCKPPVYHERHENNLLTLRNAALPVFSLPYMHWTSPLVQICYNQCSLTCKKRESLAIDDSSPYKYDALRYMLDVLEHGPHPSL